VGIRNTTDYRQEGTMQTELLDQWTTVSRQALESMKQLGQINERILARMMEQQQQILSA
jgi:flagellar biosynthesis/type III secretory pathway chaperone